MARNLARIVCLIVYRLASYCRARRGFVKKPGLIRVRIGPPIKTEAKKARAVNDEARDWIEGTMAALLGAPEKPVDPKKEKVA